MALVYIISAYKLPEQLVRLVRRLQAEDVAFLIHVDRRTDAATYQRMESGLREFHNVQFLERHNCRWGDFGHVRASLKGLAAIVDQQIPCDHAILLTGQDYPLRTTPDIAQFLEKHTGQSFLQFTELPDEAWDVMDRMERWHYWPFGVHMQFPFSNKKPRLLWFKRMLNACLPRKRAFPAGFTPYGGPGYWCLSREAVNYIHEFVSSHPKFVKFFRSTFISDEIFFHTVLMNSPLQDTVINDDLRFIDWSSRDGQRPTIFNHHDVPSMLGSGKLFARKFDIRVDADVLDELDNELNAVPAAQGSLQG